MAITLFGLTCSTGDTDSNVLVADQFHPNLTVEDSDPNPPTNDEDHKERTTVFSWPDLGTVHVRDGCEITGDLVDDAEPHVVRNLLIGICFGELLRQRGFLVFHGSVVEVDGQTVAFVGNKRAGKSTSAAALLARGHEFLSDDIVAVRFDGATPMVTPGFPMFKFEPEEFDDSDLPAHPAPNPDTGYGKQYYELDGDFDWEERELSTITLLDPNTDGPRREELRGHDAVMAVLEHSWPVRLQGAPYVENAEESVGDPDLDRYARLVEGCRVQRVSLDHDHETLDELGRDLEALLATDGE